MKTPANSKGSVQLTFVQ